MDKEIGKILVGWKADMDKEPNLQKQAVLLTQAINDIACLFDKELDVWKRKSNSIEKSYAVLEIELNKLKNEAK